MGRRKTAVADGTPTETPPEAIPLPGDQTEQAVVPDAAPVNPTLPESNGTHAGASNGNGDTRKPVISWRVQSDRTTSVELACWVNTYRAQSGEEYEQLSFTVTRSYKNGDDQWVKGGSWRTHDIPVLMFLLSKAHAYALDNRTKITPEVPF